jgi:pentapeptide repeat protein/alpha/beta hydrolase family protein
MNRVFEEGSGKCILASSLDGQASFKMNDQEYSRFTYYLLEGLKGGRNGRAVDDNGNVTPSTLSNYIYDCIPSLDKQKPITKIAMSGDLVIASYPELARSTTVNKNITTLDQTSDSLYLLLRDGHVHQFNLVRKDFVNLQGRNLQRKNLQNVNFSKANLQRINLREASLKGTDFSNANLQEAKLEGAELAGTDIPNVARHLTLSEDNYFSGNLPNKTVYINGYKMRYLEFDDNTSTGKENSSIKTVILLHGLIGSAEVWLPIVSALSKFFRVLIPDIVGFGYSDKPVIEYIFLMLLLIVKWAWWVTFYRDSS